MYPYLKVITNPTNVWERNLKEHEDNPRIKVKALPFKEYTPGYEDAANRMTFENGDDDDDRVDHCCGDDENDDDGDDDSDEVDEVPEIVPRTYRSFYNIILKDVPMRKRPPQLYCSVCEQWTGARSKYDDLKRMWDRCQRQGDDDSEVLSHA